ncbi:5'-methylthioadenosine/adenosylhomocysteine nucleosidase [Tepidibacter formicigenes]|jgi:adenosylhomocysteine nucleosidase|uniref:adenosylhomocysteine nucleosidase n=1 Tax=Tepidibacter formicigenes DSM 15518 TaxID=1123349 RepID=A0A1M6KEW0_9FIRM|nr:5'-methylthioadenosine/adenosylhomocysteine nucleosidase [Tepidibacter formicigenes]SHJ57449.1 adenosylhomocysteine nucleosidase [Tepidibacter formicigenes DSM 15518]
MNRIGIIGAMDEEVDILKELMNIEETIEKASLKFYVGKLENKDVVLVRCGIGKVNAALCTQILISEFKVEAVINTGVAGALHDELDVFDIVISTDTLHHDFDTSVFGYELGIIPRMETSIFKADDRLIDVAYNSSIKNVKNHKVLKGRVVTGDIFVSSKELKDKLVNKLNGYCAEMEGAAIGHTCFVNNVPFVIIRAMSDKADGSADVTYEEFVQEAAHNSKDIVLSMLKNI